MGNLLFSPSGRINSGDFMKGVTLIVIVTVVLGLLPVLSTGLAALGIIGFVFLWCWVVLWVKRYHDAGKSGWMCLVPIIVYIIVALIVNSVVSSMFIDPNFAAVIEEATESGDLSALFKAAGSGGLTKTGLIVKALAAGAVSYGIAFLFNNMIKGDAGDNQFGPQT